MGKIITVSSDGSVQVTENAASPSLKEMRFFVGGQLELAAWPTRHIPYEGEEAQYFVNEEGRILGLSANAKASEICQVERWQQGLPMCGNMVILTGDARWD